MKTVLNVGSNSKDIPLPPQYASFKTVFLDIDPSCSPDILCDARELITLEPKSFDAIYCSHNLEHYYRHDVRKVLAGFLHILKDDGFIQVTVPDIGAVMRACVEHGLDIDDVLYQSIAGPITAHDSIYGWALKIEQSGQDYFAHKSGFSQKSLCKELYDAGFVRIFSQVGYLEINAIAFTREPTESARKLWEIP